MSWDRLDNPKPSAASFGRDSVRVKARTGAHDSRYIVIQIGTGIAVRGSFTKPEHRCHIMKGKGEDDGKIAVSLDDSAGPFTAKRRKDGHYSITIRGSAAAGRFSTAFPPFERGATVVPMQGSPAVIVFEATADFLAV